MSSRSCALRSPGPDRGRWRRARAHVLAGLLACGVASACAQAGARAAALPGTEPRPTAGAAAVEAAASALRASGDLGGTRRERTWRLVSDDEERPPPARSDAWLGEFVRWLAEQMRVLVWIAGALV